MFKPNGKDKKKILEAASLLLGHFDGCDEDVVLQGLLQTIAAAQGGNSLVALNKYNAAGDCLAAAVSFKHQGKMQEARALALKSISLDGIEELASQINQSNSKSYLEIASEEYLAEHDEELADGDDDDSDDEEEESDYSDKPSSLARHARKRRLRQAKA